MSTQMHCKLKVQIRQRCLVSIAMYFELYVGTIYPKIVSCCKTYCQLWSTILEIKVSLKSENVSTVSVFQTRPNFISRNNREQTCTERRLLVNTEDKNIYLNFYSFF